MTVWYLLLLEIFLKIDESVNLHVCGICWNLRNSPSSNKKQLFKKHLAIGFQPWFFFFFHLNNIQRYSSSEKCYETKVRIGDVFPLEDSRSKFRGSLMYPALLPGKAARPPSRCSLLLTVHLPHHHWHQPSSLERCSRPHFLLEEAKVSGAETGKTPGHLSKQTSCEQPDHKPLRSRRRTELGLLVVFSFHICKIIPKIITKHNAVFFFGNTVLEWWKKYLKKTKASSPLKSYGWRFCDDCPAFHCPWEGKGLWW